MKDSRKANAKRVGLNNRKYNEKCSYCGKNEHYAKGYCKTCYTRYRRNGFVEPKYNGRSKRPPKLTEKQIKRFLKDLKKYRKRIEDRAGYYRWTTGEASPTFSSAKRIYSQLGIDVYKRLKIEGRDK